MQQQEQSAPWQDAQTASKQQTAVQYAAHLCMALVHASSVQAVSVLGDVRCEG
jgi:hypothetical protein